MKKHIHTVFMVLFFLNNIYAQDCCIPQYLIDSYERDVKHLALVRMEMFDAPQYNFVEIDPLWQDTIWEGLAAIYNSNSFASDDVFNKYCIHHNSYGAINDFLKVTTRMYVRPDTSVSWFQNWIDGDIITNDPYIDSLTQKYGFDEVELTFIFGAFTITTDQYLNLYTLADSLELSDSILSAEPRNSIGGTKEISYRKIDNNRYFDFIVGWGDCLSGCLYNHTWSFLVDEDCNAFYLGSSGGFVPDYLIEDCDLVDHNLSDSQVDGLLALCESDSTVLKAEGGAAYYWNTGAITDSILVTESGYYAVTITGEDGCPNLRSLYVLEYSSPDGSIVGDLEICAGGSTELIASGGANYQWSNGENVDSITVSAGGMYTVTVTGENGCEEAYTVNLIVNELPVVELNLGFDTICIEDGEIALLGGIPVGGEFLEPYIVSGIFDPLLAGLGTHTITYEYQDVHACVGSMIKEVVVLEGSCVTNSNILEEKLSFEIAPNPTTGNILIQIDGGLYNNETILRLYNASGELVTSEQATYQNVLEMSNQPKGIYYLVVSNSQVVLSEKIIVQ